MQRDKKVVAGQLRFVLPERVGRAVVVDDVEPPEMLNAWRELVNLEEARR